MGWVPIRYWICRGILQLKMSTNKNNNNNNNNNSILDNVLKGLVTLVFAALAGTVSGNVHSNANEMKRRNNTDNIEKAFNTQDKGE